MSKSLTPSRRQFMLGSAAGTAMATASFATAAAQPIAQSATESVKAPDLSGLSVLITGCSSGFGRLSAEYFARLGAKVFATMRNMPRPEADELTQFAAENALDLHIIEIDVTLDDQVTKGVAAALEKTGGTLDVLVNNAGISTSGPIEVQDMEATKLLFETNVFGPQRLARAALPAMRAAKSGLIFNVTSQLGRVMIPGFGQYSPTKFALEAMSEQMAYELAPHGIEVTIIQPGGYPTKIWENQAPLSGALKARAPEEVLAAYPQLTARMGASGGGGGSTDPMDIPRAMAEIISLPAGMRPLRRAVHPGSKPQVPINEVSAKQQLAFLGESAYGPWIKAVLNP